MQVVQVNTVGLQATRAFVTLTQKCFRATVLCLKTAFPVNPSLAGEDQVSTTVPQRSGDQSLALALNTLAECCVKKISSRVGGGFPCGQASASETLMLVIPAIGPQPRAMVVTLIPVRASHPPVPRGGSRYGLDQTGSAIPRPRRHDQTRQRFFRRGHKAFGIRSAQRRLRTPAGDVFCGP